MKIIQIIYSLSSGGAERFVVDLSNELANMGHDVTVCMLLKDDNAGLTFNKKFINDNVKFHAMNFDKGFSIHKSDLLQAYIKKENPDIVHCHLNVIPYIFRLCLFDRHIKFFHTLHSIAEHASGSGWQYHINKFYYKHNLIRPICISELCLKSYINLFKLNNAPVIDNGRAFPRASDKFNAVKTEVDCLRHEQSPVFIHVARYNFQKNQELLVDSFNALYENGLNYTLLIIGNGYNSDDGIKLQKRACKNIHFLGEKDNVCDYLLCSDAFCLSSRYEGLPISLLEALACGLTPICTAVGGVPDVIEDGVTGYLSSGQDVVSYIDAIKRFIERPLDKNMLIDYFKKNYSMEVCAKKYEAEYLKCLNVRK